MADEMILFERLCLWCATEHPLRYPNSPHSVERDLCKDARHHYLPVSAARAAILDARRALSHEREFAL